MTESIHVFAICYNEELLLPYFIRHYRAMGAEKITIHDNYSTDRSRQIAIEAGCEVIDWDSGDQIRDDLYLNIKNNCWKSAQSDWVIVCDIDEFLILPEEIDTKKYSIIYTNGYDMVGLPPPAPIEYYENKINPNVWLFWNYEGVSNLAYSKIIMFRPSMVKEINYRAGCHFCKPFGHIVGNRKFATILHYAYPSEDRVLAKYKEYESRLSDINKQNDWGHQYKSATEESVKAKFDELRANSRVILI